MRNPVHADSISKSIITLHTDFPDSPLGEHIANALNGGDIYNFSDRELADALSAYLVEIEQ